MSRTKQRHYHNGRCDCGNCEACEARARADHVIEVTHTLEDDRKPGFLMIDENGREVDSRAYVRRLQAEMIARSRLSLAE